MRKLKRYVRIVGTFIDCVRGGFSIHNAKNFALFDADRREQNTVYKPTYYVRLKYNSFWGIENADSQEDAKAKGKLLLADLILKGIAILEIVERDDPPKENRDE